MTTKELMIGNWIDLPSGRRVEIKEVLSSMILVSSHPDLQYSKSYTVPLAGCTPIPLTEEILLKIGFIKNGFNNLVMDINPFDMGNKSIYFAHDYLYLTEGRENKEGPENDLICLWNKDLKKEFYVHELQNLYFLLTGKELNFKL